MNRAELLRAIRNAPVVGHVLQDASVRAAIFPFALTRIMVFVLFILALQFTVPNPPKQIGELQYPIISLRRAPVAEKMRWLAGRSDGAWYLAIARDGYEHRPFSADEQHKWAFFPLWPILIRAAATVTGEFELTSLLLSNIIFLLALVLLHKTVLAYGWGKDAADRALLYIAAFPTSYFFSLVFTESLFLLLTVGSFYFAKRGRWWWAGAFGTLATATRFAGIALLPALVIMYWQEHRKERPKWDALALLLIPSGLIAFMIYLYFITGNAWAFSDVQQAWGRSSGLILRPLWEYISDPAVVAISWNFRLLNFLSAVLALSCGAVLAKRREWSLALFTLISVFAPLSSLSLQSMTRYVLVIFPIFILLALTGRSARVHQTIQAIFISLLSLMVVLFAAHFSIALA